MVFEDNSKSVEKELAMLLGRVSHHIHPKIVKLIQSKNKELLNEFKCYCHPKLNYLDFFYEGSDSTFPGVRRPINKEKVDKWKNRINESDGTIFNDNTYPRHIWAFLTIQKSYSSKTWIESGLNAFELAHIFGHKKDEQELEKKVFEYFDNDFNPYALFTSASNVVLIPKGLTKPTDNMESIKLCFYQRHIELYGQYFKGIKGFKKELLPSWYSQIEWLDPILPINWEENIQKLIIYRNNHLRNKYQKLNGIDSSIRSQSTSTIEINKHSHMSKKTKKRPSRRKVFDFINFKTNSLIDINFFNLSTINSTGKFSVEPKLGSEEQEWFLALVDTSKNIINFFIVPANSSVYNKLYVRDYKQRYRLIFHLNDISYREEHSHERFDKFQVDKYDFEDESIF